MTRLLKRYLSFLTGLTGIVLSAGMYSHSFGQIALYTGTNGLSYELAMDGYKWGFNQTWNQPLNSWGDTNSIYTTITDNNNLPVEIISKSKNEKDVWVNAEKNVITYENKKIKTLVTYQYLVDSSKYSENGLSATFSWANDSILQKITTEIPVMFFMELMMDSIKNYQTFFPFIKNAKLISETNITIENNKIISELTRARISGVNILTLKLLKPMLDSMGLTADTTMVDVRKAIYKYGTGYKLCTQSEWVADQNEWVLVAKDSAIFKDGKTTALYSSEYDVSSDVWDYNSKDTMIYNTDGKIVENINSVFEGNSWLNSNRTIYRYTPYQQVSVNKALVSKTEEIRATRHYTKSKPVIDLTLSSEATVTYQISDMTGRTIDKTIKKTLHAGSHSIPLFIRSPGNYLFSIKSGTSTFAFPVTIIR